MKKYKYSKKETISFIKMSIRIREGTDKTKANKKGLERDLKVLKAVENSNTKIYNDCHPASLATLFSISV